MNPSDHWYLILFSMRFTLFLFLFWTWWCLLIRSRLLWGCMWWLTSLFSLNVLSESLFLLYFEFLSANLQNNSQISYLFLIVFIRYPLDDLEVFLFLTVDIFFQFLSNFYYFVISPIQNLFIITIRMNYERMMLE